MIRQAIILMSLCSAILCGFVGYLSYQAVEKANVQLGDGERMSAEAIVKSPPVETARVQVNSFVKGKSIAHLDFDGDEKWDIVCVPLFPQVEQKMTHSYRAVLVCFRGVPDQDSLDEIIASGEIDTTYWPQKQELEVAIHSPLAQKYKHLDFEHSPVLRYGFSAANPLLGKSTLQASAAIGGGAILVMFLTLLAGLFGPRQRRNRDDADEDDQPLTNRAGLPPATNHLEILPRGEIR